jgi:Uma2 family endonuclease
MSTALAESRQIWVAPGVPRRRYSVDEYHSLIKSGRIDERDRLELLEGWIVDKMPQNAGHALVIERLLLAIARLLPDDWSVRGQSPITTTDSEPEPDLAIIRMRRRGISSSHPRPGDIALVVEVSDSRITEDRTVKSRVYARSMIPSYWIVNLPRRCVEVYSEPAGPDALEPMYQSKTVVPARGHLDVILNGRSIGRIAVKSILP